MLMPNYLKVSTTGAFTSVDGSKTLQTVHTEYIAVNKGTASSPDWQAVGMLGESITHHGTSPAHGQHTVSTRSAHHGMVRLSWPVANTLQRSH